MASAKIAENTANAALAIRDRGLVIYDFIRAMDAGMTPEQLRDRTKTFALERECLPHSKL